MKKQKLSCRFLAFSLAIMLAFPTAVYAEPENVGSQSGNETKTETITDDTTQTPPSDQTPGETPTPEDPTPEDPKPEDPTPEDPTPEDPTPEDPKPENPEPTKPVNPTLVVPSTLSIQYKAGKTYALKVKTNSNGAVKYSSSNTKVAAVSHNGVLSIKGLGVSYITVKVSATKKYNAIQKKVRISVWKKPSNIGYSASYKKGVFYKRLMGLQLYGSTRENIAAVAASQLGYHESSSSKKLAGNIKASRNYTEFGRYYGYNGVPWCAIFVNWVARQNNISRSVVPKYCAVRQYYSYYNRRHLVRSWSQARTGKYTPKKGDIIFYSYSYKATTHHIGYVENFERVGSKIVVTTLEGNRSDKVSRCKMTLKKSNAKGKVAGYYITGFASPRY